MDRQIEELIKRIDKVESNIEHLRNKNSILQSQIDKLKSNIKTTTEVEEHFYHDKIKIRFR